MIKKQSSINCTVCESEDLKTVIDFGKQPPSNRFSSKIVDNNDNYRLALGYCNKCLTVQLTKRIPLDAIKPQYDWIQYNEAESHLDNLVTMLSCLSGIKKDSKFLGITYKDKSTLSRLRNMGFLKTQCCIQSDYGIPPFEIIGLETIQNALKNSSVTLSITEKYGKNNVLIARHILEHTDSVVKFILSLKNCLYQDGYLVLEFPDSSKMFYMNNHCFVWEEHLSYFEMDSINHLCSVVGARLIFAKRYIYPVEDILIAVLKFDREKKSEFIPEQKHFIGIQNRLSSFKENLDIKREMWRRKLINLGAERRKIAVFGAGHIASKFINFMHISDIIDCVVDDNQNKIGLLMPGSGLEIISSRMMLERKVKLCLSTLSYESNVKIKKKLYLASYFNRGGLLLSVFR